MGGSPDGGGDLPTGLRLHRRLSCTSNSLLRSITILKAEGWRLSLALSFQRVDLSDRFVFQGGRLIVEIIAQGYCISRSEKLKI